MSIERIGKPPVAPGVPVISFAAVHGGIVYLCGITADPRKPLGDVKQQTREVLGQIDALLDAAGTTKASDRPGVAERHEHFADHNDAWNAWVDREHPPVRACVQSPRLWAPGYGWRLWSRRHDDPATLAMGRIGVKCIQPTTFQRA
jgi:enamine deaminase RidA (YjgF/YER057c/UK114 family)